MLVALSIRDIVLIDHLDLSLAKGLTFSPAKPGRESPSSSTA